MPIEDQRHGLRFSLATALVFIIGVLLDWPSAYLSAVFVSILLEKNSPPSLRGATILFLACFAIYLLVYVLFALLLPYPVLFFVALGAALAGVFAMSVTGKNNLLVIMSLFATLIIPYVAATSPSAAWTQAVWIPMNLGIALIVTWGAFIIFPTVDSVETKNYESSSSPGDRELAFAKLMIATTPFVLLFILIDGDHLLTLLYFGLFATQLATSDGNGAITPLQKLLANIGAIIAAIVAYEVIVIAPTIITMIVTISLLCTCFGWWLTSGFETAILARSALTGAIILLADALAPLSDTAEVSSIERIFEIFIAVVLVSIVFSLLNRLLPGQRDSPMLQHGNQG